MELLANSLQKVYNCMTGELWRVFFDALGAEPLEGSAHRIRAPVKLTPNQFANQMLARTLVQWKRRRAKGFFWVFSVKLRFRLA